MGKNIILDINHLMADMVGFQYGISAEEISARAQQAAAAWQAVNKARGTGWLGWTELPYNQEGIVRDILQAAK